MSFIQSILMVPSAGLDRNYTNLVIYIHEKGIPQINERYILVHLFAVVLAATFGVRHLIQQRDHIFFPPVQLSTWDHLRNNFREIISKSWTFAAKFTSIFWIVYNIFLSRFLIRIAMRLVAEDILYHIAQYGPRWYSIKLASRLFWGTFVTTALLESVHAICDQFLSKSMHVSDNSVDPNACLISGLNVDASVASPECILTYHAFQELHHLAGYSATRRADIFNDVTSVPSAWKQIMAQSIHVINKSKARIDGQGASTPGAAVAAAPTNLTESTRRRLAPGKGGAVETNIFKPVKHDASWKGMFDSMKGLSTEELLAKERLAMDLAEGKKPDPTVRPVHLGPKERPEVLAFRWLAKSVGDSISKQPLLQKQLSGNPDTALLQVMDDYQLVIWSFQSLALLVNASYREDKLGVVQSDISVVLEAMLGLLMSLEKFTRSAAFVTATSNNDSVQALVGVRSVAMLEALKTSIYQIVDTFRDHLSDILREPKYSERLRQFGNLDD
ncbi:Nucleoporin NDC1 [Podila epigama]|nr:Nucleoporin NDC1 [Podila epigama]